MINRVIAKASALLGVGPDHAERQKLAAVAQMRKEMLQVYWFRDQHQISAKGVTVRGSAAFRKAPQPDSLRLLIGGQPAALEFTEPGEHLRNAFWYLPDTHVVGLVATAEMPPLPKADPPEHPENYLDVTLDMDRSETTEWLRTFQISPHFLSFRPVPEIPNIERVSGRGATSYNYWNNGRTDFRRFSAMAAAHGVDVTSPKTRILDWGCGCARLTRHFRALPDGAGRVYGIDIDPVNIGWCQENSAADGFAVTPLLPPSGVDGPFDLIFGNSVITHLKRDVMDLWLAELARLLAPGGVALLSFHGNFSAAAICSRNLGFWQKVRESGFDASTAAVELNDAIEDPEYYRQTFMTDKSARDIFSAHFRVEEIHAGVVSRYQNVAVLRKR